MSMASTDQEPDTSSAAQGGLPYPRSALNLPSKDPPPPPMEVHIAPDPDGDLPATRAGAPSSRNKTRAPIRATDLMDLVDPPHHPDSPRPPQGPRGSSLSAHHPSPGKSRDASPSSPSCLPPKLSALGSVEDGQDGSWRSRAVERDPAGGFKTEAGFMDPWGRLPVSG